MAVVQFGAWQPDLVDLGSRDAYSVRNVLASGRSYIPAKDAPAFTSALPARPVGEFMAVSLDGSVHIFAGTATGLYRLNGATLAWDDVSRTVGGAYTATAIERWSFAQYGNYVIAVNINDAPQVFELGVSTHFADLGGAPPQGRYVAVWGDFLVIGSLTNQQNRLEWSDINDITNWSTGLSDGQTFPDGGAITALTSGQAPMVFQERAVTRAVFVPGSSAAFTFTKVLEDRGARSPYAVAERDNTVFFLAEDGFYATSGVDGSLKPIGKERVDRYFLSEINRDSLLEVLGEVDPIHSRVYWAYRSVEENGANFDRIIVYDWSVDRWTELDHDNYGIVRAATIGYTLEDLDAFGTLDSLPYSLDDRAWAGGAPVLGAFNTSYEFGFFSGSNKEATLTTAEMQMLKGQRAQIGPGGVQPLIDTANVYIRAEHRERRGVSFTNTTEVLPSTATGIARLRGSGRFHRFRARIPAGTPWTHAQGLDIDAVEAGAR